MKRFLIFVCALFVFGTAHADDIVCDAGSYFNGTECEICPAGTYSAGGDATECTPCPDDFPNSEPGATDESGCYSNELERPWTGIQICYVPSECIDAICAPCEIKPCKYVAYAERVRKSGKWVYIDGEIKSGCSSNDAKCMAPVQSAVALPGWRAVGTERCEQCPAGTYSAGGENATCEPCPDGATTSEIGTTTRDECMRILNYLTPGATTPMQISLKLKQNTTPAFAAQIGNDIFYGDMTPVDTTVAPGLYVGYNNQKYHITDNTFVVQTSPISPSDSFIITTTPDTSSFEFTIVAKGEFAVDWGDGDVENMDHSSTNYATYSHTYDVAAKRIIKLSGRATGYHRAKKGAKWVYHTLSFADNAQIAQINGSLGAVFPTLDDGTNPNFDSLFKDEINLTGQIPPNLFTGIVGSPANSIHSYMFRSVFEGCSGLTGEIPVGLFGNLSGAPGESTFVNAFQGCSGLTGAPAQNPDGTPLYDIEYDGQTWYEQSPGAFTDMYTDSGIDTSN